MEERLQKLLSANGIASRREAERLITAGRVMVNGRIATLGEKADIQQDIIEIDGKTLQKSDKRTYIMLNKPRGYVTTLSDEKGRKNVAQLVTECGARVWPVGRLDLNSEGLLLMTDDGDFTHKILHPSNEIEKEYMVWAKGGLDTALPVLSRPMELDGEPLAPAKVKKIKSQDGVHQLSITIHQGKNRQIRRMCAQVGLAVIRLKRIREGSITLNRDLKVGTWRHLTNEEINTLLNE